MSVIKLGTNVASLLVQRNLATATSALQTNFERLSSGLRINSAKDDAAGLALAEKLNADARVYTQAILNVNDGISLLNVAEAALNELSSIVTRQIELAQSASNGTYSRAQRIASQEEINALVEEYNRIVGSSEFNDIALLEDNSLSLYIQAGYGTENSIGIELGSELSRTAGDGTFAAVISLAAGVKPRDLSVVDLNGDGILDILSVDRDTGMGTYLGNGDGTFKARLSFASYGFVWGLDTADFNGDGLVDVVTANHTGDPLAIYLGNGDGTFTAKTSFAAGPSMRRVVTGDYNGDGRTDLAATSYDGDAVYVLLGNGDGSFDVGTSYAVGDAPVRIVTGDFNGDGISDLATADYYSGTMSVLFGSSGGIFQNAVTYTGTAKVFDLFTSDVNKDGILDIVTAEYVDAVTPGIIGIYLGSSDGSFTREAEYSAEPGTTAVSIADLNGDGLADLAATNINSDSISIFIGRGDGTFSASGSISMSGQPGSIIIEDLNADGAFDLVTGNYGAGSLGVLLGNTQTLHTEAFLNISTQEAAQAALVEATNTLERVTAELGKVGAMQSRFTHTVSNLQQIRENYLTAKSQITDADVALEAAELVRNQILQQAAAAVLAQANQQSSIALLLLGGGIT